MSIAIIQITQAELAEKAISTNREELTFENQVFSKGPSFSLKCKEPALKYCQQMAKLKLKSLLIQEKYGFTIWTQSQKPGNQGLNGKERYLKTSSLTKTQQKSASGSNILEKYQGQGDKLDQQENQNVFTKYFSLKLLRQKY
ncbi:MAG: hypothetical protein QNJ34_23065 [Xenococcaceae cyanobacterium MO_188.B29]|nr:hypothetical protein [Xenococcaceae cyanobacterium MO_188.B29]